MWISLSDAFLSVIAIPDDPRPAQSARTPQRGYRKGFPNAVVQRTPGRDYPYRTEIPRAVVSSAIAASLDAINYENFKSSVNDDRLHSAYSSV